MVKVREDHPVDSEGRVDLRSWLGRLKRHVNLSDEQAMVAACDMAVAAEKSPGNPSSWSQMTGTFKIGMEMTDILAELRLDQASLIAALLYRPVREKKLALSDVRKRFGDEIAELVKGVLGMAVINAIQNPARAQVLGQQQDQLDKVRKMLVSIIDDVRVALIKLAERTCAIRAVKGADRERRQRVAREVFEIYAPLAHRLGIGYIKWELEDLAFRYLKPQDYKKIAKWLDEKRLDREQYIYDAIRHLQIELKTTGIMGDVNGRVKHIYSIWRKMRSKGVEFRNLYDIRALRILVNEVRDCYASLGVVHSLWNHIPKEFDDYIATPKENGYQSLHTAVIGPNGKTLEVQIRTYAMHDEAELGVCAHWKYKGASVKTETDSYEEKLNWLRQVLEWQEEIGEGVEGLADQWRLDVEPDRVYVFTKDGHVVDLPVGATPVDFAYRVHTEVGNRCRGAKVGGRIVPLNYTLKTGAQIEILTASNAVPSRDWLNQNLGYIKTSRARAKIVSWFRKQNQGSNIEAGRRFIEAELKRLDINKVDLLALAKTMKFHAEDDLFAACGAGDIRTRQVVNAAQRQVEPEEESVCELRTRSQTHRNEGNITIHGVGNLLTQMAGCCHPLPGDSIVGYITLGRGVTIHRSDCANALQLQEQESDRLIEVNWGEDKQYTYPVEIYILAYDRSGLLRDVTVVLANEQANVLDLQIQMLKNDNIAKILLTIEIATLNDLGRILTKIHQLANVIEARRNRKV